MTDALTPGSPFWVWPFRTGPFPAMFRGHWWTLLTQCVCGGVSRVNLFLSNLLHRTCCGCTPSTDSLERLNTRTAKKMSAMLSNICFCISLQWLRCLWTYWASAPMMSWRLTRSWTVRATDRRQPQRCSLQFALAPLEGVLCQWEYQTHAHSKSHTHTCFVFLLMPWLLCPIFTRFSLNLCHF